MLSTNSGVEKKNVLCEKQDTGKITFNHNTDEKKMYTI